MTHSQNEPVNSRMVPQQTLSSVSGRTALDQRIPTTFQNTSHLSGTTSTLNNSFTSRNSAALFTETTVGKQPLAREESAFRRPLSEQDNNPYNQLRSALKTQLTSQISQRSPQNGSINGYQEQSSIISRPSMLSDTYIGMSMIVREICLLFF